MKMINLLPWRKRKIIKNNNIFIAQLMGALSLLLLILFFYHEHLVIIQAYQLNQLRQLNLYLKK